MPDGGSTTALIGAIAGPIIGGLLGGNDSSPSPPPIPTQADVNQGALASATRRRALARGGRTSTILTDPSETVPGRQIGRATLLGG